MSPEAWVLLVLLVIITGASIGAIVWLVVELRAARTRSAYFEAETRSLIASLARSTVEGQIYGDPLPPVEAATSDRERAVLERLHEADARIRGLGATGQADE